jgi:hypothetical protein
LVVTTSLGYFELQVLKNNSTLIPASETTVRGSSTDRIPGVVSTIVSLTANDYVTLQVRHVTGVNTLYNITFSVRKLKALFDTSGTSGTSGTAGSSGTTGTSGGAGTAGTSGSATIPGSNNEVLTSNGAGAAVSEANLTFDGNLLTVAGAIKSTFDPTGNTYLTADNTGFGEIVNFGNTATTAGQIYYLNTSGTWTIAQANVFANAGGDMLAIALGSNSTTNGMLVRGFFRSSQFTVGNIGEPLFLSAASSGVTVASAPSSAGNIVRVIGYVVGSTTQRRVYFNPSQDWIEL